MLSKQKYIQSISEVAQGSTVHAFGSGPSLIYMQRSGIGTRTQYLTITTLFYMSNQVSLTTESREFVVFVVWRAWQPVKRTGGFGLYLTIVVWLNTYRCCMVTAVEQPTLLL